MNGGHHFPIFLPVLLQLVTLCYAILHWYCTVISVKVAVIHYINICEKFFFPCSLATGERENKGSLTVH